MKKIFLILLILFTLVSCSNNESVAKMLTNYYNTDTKVVESYKYKNDKLYLISNEMFPNHNYEYRISKTFGFGEQDTGKIDVSFTFNKKHNLVLVKKNKVYDMKKAFLDLIYSVEDLNKINNIYNVKLENYEEDLNHIKIYKYGMASENIRRDGEVTFMYNTNIMYINIQDYFRNKNFTTEQLLPKKDKRVLNIKKDGLCYILYLDIDNLNELIDFGVSVENFAKDKDYISSVYFDSKPFAWIDF